MAIANNERDMLISAVVLSIKDAFTNPRSPNDMKTITNQTEAVHFLTDKSGAWAQSRRDICMAIGFCPDRLRTKIIGMKKDGTTLKDISGLVEAIMTEARREREASLAEKTPYRSSK